MPGKTIETGRNVYLRRPSKGDQAEFLRRVRISKSLHNPWVYPLNTKASFDQYLKRLRSKRNFGFLVCLRNSHEIVGVINLNEIVWGIFQSAYLGFYAMRPYAGKGYMSEGLKLAIKHAFIKMKLHRLEANIQPENKKSIALVKGCGFQKEGYSPKYLKIGGKWKDHERWTILVDDFL